MKWVLDDDLVEKLYQQTKEKKGQESLIKEMYSSVMDAAYKECPLMSSEFYKQLNRKVYCDLIQHNNYIQSLNKEDFLSELINKLESIKMEANIIFDRIQNNKFKIDAGDIVFTNATGFFSNKDKENTFYIIFLNLCNIFDSLEVSIKDSDINFKIIKLENSEPEVETIVEIINHNKDIFFSKIKSEACDDFIESLIFLKQLSCKMLEKGISDKESEQLFENFKGYYFKNKQDIVECIDKIYLEKDIKIDF